MCSSGSRTAHIHFNDPLWLIPRLLTKVHSIWVSTMYPFAHKGRKLSIHYTCDLANTGLIELGSFVTIHKDVWLHAVRSPGNNGQPVLTVGDRCFIGRRCQIAAKNRVHIEPQVMLSASVLIQDHGHAHSDLSVPIRDQGNSKGGRIRIGEGSWIGQGAAIICEQGELVLGKNCVVAANAVVTRSAPPYSVLSGNPARIVKQFDMMKQVWALGSIRSEANSPK